MMNLFPGNIKIENLEVAAKFLKESRDGFLKLFDNSPICMSMTTLEKRAYVRVNKKFLEKFGFTEQEIIGRTSVEVGILDKEESVRVGSIIKEKGGLQNDYVKCISKDREIVHTVSSIEKMEINGETYLVSFFLDITKIMAQQALIEQQAQQLAAVNKELEAFSYSVSHDLMAPLRAINGFTGILEEDFYELLNEEGKRVLSAVRYNAKKMESLINDLLAFARLGKQAIRKTDIDMSKLIGEVLTDLKTVLNHRAEIKVNTLHKIKGDYALIKQVMINLISNAIKYSSKKENPVVEIGSEVKDNKVIYMVKDNGAGFDMEHARNLFGVFQRLHSNEEFEGTGVGLAIVQRIINKHEGTIYAEAELGKGATFRFAMPL